MQKKAETTSAGRNFSETHPKLNLLLGLCIVLILLVSVFWAIWNIGNLIKDYFNWLLTTVSKLDAVVIVALITGAVSIVGVVISSVGAKYIEYKKIAKTILRKNVRLPMATSWK